MPGIFKFLNMKSADQLFLVCCKYVLSSFVSAARLEMQKGETLKKILFVVFATQKYSVSVINKTTELPQSGDTRRSDSKTSNTFHHRLSGTNRFKQRNQVSVHVQQLTEPHVSIERLTAPYQKIVFQYVVTSKCFSTSLSETTSCTANVAIWRTCSLPSFRLQMTCSHG